MCACVCVCQKSRIHPTPNPERISTPYVPGPEAEVSWSDTLLSCIVRTFSNSLVDRESLSELEKLRM